MSLMTRNLFSFLDKWKDVCIYLKKAWDKITEILYINETTYVILLT